MFAMNHANSTPDHLAVIYGGELKLAFTKYASVQYFQYISLQ